MNVRWMNWAAGDQRPSCWPSAIESERPTLYAYLVGPVIFRDLSSRSDSPKPCSSQTCIVRGQGKAVGVRVAGGFAVCGAALSLYIRANSAAPTAGLSMPGWRWAATIRRRKSEKRARDRTAYRWAASRPWWLAAARQPTGGPHHSKSWGTSFSVSRCRLQDQRRRQWKP